MKKLTALLLALVLVLSLVACSNVEAPPATDGTGTGTDANTDTETPGTDPAPGADDISEEEAAAMRDAGTLQSDPLTGYEYSEAADSWYYSNYPNYKDFNADGKIKVAFVCKFSGSWFTPKQESLGEVCAENGYEYLFIDANSDEQAWLDSVQNVINQDFDAVVLTPVNTAMLADAVTMLQAAGIAYLTTDDPGADTSGFYVPHYGLDDYYLFNELGKHAANRIASKNFMDGVADDYSNFLFVIMDSPSVESIHNRSLGYYDAIVAAYPDIPESQILWLDCGNGLTDDIIDKLSHTLQANIAGTDKWIFASGTGSSVIPTITLLQENQIPLENTIISEGVSTDDILGMMLEDEDIANCSIHLGLVSRPSGTGIGKLLVDLFENGTPLPCLTSYEMIAIDADTVQDFYDTYF